VVWPLSHVIYDIFVNDAASITGVEDLQVVARPKETKQDGVPALFQHVSPDGIQHLYSPILKLWSQHNQAVTGFRRQIVHDTPV